MASGIMMGFNKCQAGYARRVKITRVRKSQDTTRPQETGIVGDLVIVVRRIGDDEVVRCEREAVTRCEMGGFSNNKEIFPREITTLAGSSPKL